MQTSRAATFVSKSGGTGGTAGEALYDAAPSATTLDGGSAPSPEQETTSLLLGGRGGMKRLRTACVCDLSKTGANPLQPHAFAHNPHDPTRGKFLVRKRSSLEPWFTQPVAS